MPTLIQKLLKIDQSEVLFERRGFVCSNRPAQARLEDIGRVFLCGYHAALQAADQQLLAANLNQVNLEQRGFAYEGAAMALALLDGMSLKGNALPRFMAGAGKQHIYMLHVGAGWAYARLPWMRWRMESAIGKLYPVLRWLVIDGYGFHQGYFHSDVEIRLAQPARLSNSALPLSPDARHVFYQGLGRSLWFVTGADVQAIAKTIVHFPQEFHRDAWSGAGLACAYAGGVTQNEIFDLQRLASIHASALAQGAAFASKARQLAGTPASHTHLACEILCRMSAEESASLCDETYNNIHLLHSCPFRYWQELLQNSFSLSDIPVRGKSHEPNASPTLAAAKSN